MQFRGTAQGTGLNLVFALALAETAWVLAAAKGKGCLMFPPDGKPGDGQIFAEIDGEILLKWFFFYGLALAANRSQTDFQ